MFTNVLMIKESVMVGVSAYYSRNLSKKVKKGMNENAFTGYFNGGTPPLGYQIKDKNTLLTDTKPPLCALF